MSNTLSGLGQVGLWRGPKLMDSAIGVPLSPLGVSATTQGQTVSANGSTAAPSGLSGINTSAPTGTASTGATSNSAQDIAGTDTFLKLLVAQLRNQDPSSPMDSSAFISEMAQFNTVEQMINLKTAVTSQVSAQQASEGVALLGKTITYAVPSLSGGSTTSAQGAVSGVNLVQGAITVQVGTNQVPLSEVTGVTG